jgi:5'-nucleotidase
MRLLVTNDDGIASPFLHELVRALRAAGHGIFVVAPRQEQSWIGAAKSRGRPVHSASAVDGTPSDCVNIALAHLLTDPVAGVVSGINVGLNASLGFILASGTVAGAWEGALHGLPGVAFSQEVTEATYERLKQPGGEPDAALRKTLAASAAHAARLSAELIGSTPPQRFVVHNLNFPFPCSAETPVRRTAPARQLVPGLFTPQAEDGTHRLVFRAGEDISPDGFPTDRSAITAGCISHTVLDYSQLGHV